MVYILKVLFAQTVTFFLRCYNMNDTHLLETFLQRKCWRALLGKCQPQSLGGSFGNIQGDCGPGVGVHWSAPTDLRIDRTAASSPDCSGLHTHCLLLLGEDGNVTTLTGGIRFIRLSFKVQLVLVLNYRWIQRFTYTLAIYISNYFHKLLTLSWVKFEAPSACKGLFISSHKSFIGLACWSSHLWLWNILPLERSILDKAFNSQAISSGNDFTSSGKYPFPDAMILWYKQATPATTQPQKRLLPPLCITWVERNMHDTESQQSSIFYSVNLLYLTL